MGRTIDEFIVDRVCREPMIVARDEPSARQSAGAAENPTASDSAVPALPGLAITYMFYFDQSFLTQEGRIRSMDMARQMIPELVKDGNRATIVSSGRNVAPGGPAAAAPRTAATRPISIRSAVAAERGKRGV